jgi:succinate dehydrogenase/fumarate reductase cytochrome b subunit
MKPPLTRQQVRLVGLLQFVAAGLVFAWILHWLNGMSQQHPGQPLPGGTLAAIAFALPGGLALSGLLQLITGLRHSELQAAWHGYDKVFRTFFAALGLLLFVIILVVGVQSYFERFAS